MTGRAFPRSKSQLGTYERCPKSYDFNYLRRIKLTSYWAARGIACHAALEANFRHKAETGADLDVDAVLAAFRASVDEAFSRRARAPIVLFEGQTRERMLAEGDRALRLYMAEIAPTITPLMVEEPVELTLPSGLMIRGKLDLVDTDLCIRDAKFPTDKKSVDAFVYEPDMPLYCAMFRAKTGRWPRGFIFDVVNLGRAKDPKPVARSLPFPDFDATVAPLVEARLADLEAVDQAIRGGYFPRRPSGQNCNECVFTNICWWGIKPGVPTQGPEDLVPLLQQSLERVALSLT